MLGTGSQFSRLLHTPSLESMGTSFWRFYSGVPAPLEVPRVGSVYAYLTSLAEKTRAHTAVFSSRYSLLGKGRC